jgi:hypothetical protein
MDRVLVDTPAWLGNGKSTKMLGSRSDASLQALLS